MARLIDKEEKKEVTSSTLTEQTVKQESESVLESSNVGQNVQALSNQNSTVATTTVKKFRFKVHPDLVVPSQNPMLSGTVLEYEHEKINKDATIDYDFRVAKFTVFLEDKTQYSICECDDFTTFDSFLEFRNKDYSRNKVFRANCKIISTMQGVIWT